MKIAQVLLYFCFSLTVFAQKNSSQGKKLIDMGYKEFQENNYEKAILLFENAAKQCKIDKDTSEILHSYTLIYGTLNIQTKQKDFLKYEPQLLNYLPSKNIQTISICNCLGGAYQQVPDFEKAQYYYQLAIKKIKSQKKLGDELLYLSGTNHSLLASLQVLNGDFDKGLLGYRESLNNFMQISAKLPSDWVEISKQYFIISDLYIQQKQYFQAKNFLQKAYPIIQKEDFNSQIGYHQNMAILLKPSALNKPDSALFHINLALKLLEKYKLENRKGKAYEILGNLQYEMQDYQAAQKSFETSLSIRLPQNTFKTIATSEKNIGLAMMQQKQYLSALIHFQKALQYISTDFKNNNFVANPSIEKLKYKQDAIEILKEKIGALLSIYQAEKKRNYLEVAFATAQFTKQLIDYQRNSFQLEGSKLFLSQQAHDIFGHGIEAAYLLFELTKNEKYLAEAFRLSESNKAVVLYESVKASQTIIFQGVPTEMLKKEHQYLKEMAVYENQLYKDTKNEAIWRKKLLETTDNLKKLKEDFADDYPKYYNYKYDTEPISIKETNSKLTNNQALIEYFIDKNSLFTFLITSKKSYFFKQILPADFKQNIIDFKTQLIAKAIDEKYKNLSCKIYNTLLPENIINIVNSEKIENTKIVADAELNYIPFESLLIRHPKNLKEPNIYLLEKFTIGYLPSATMNWKNTIPKTDKSLSLNYLGFAPSYKNGLDLPHNQANMSFLTNLFAGKSFLKAQATKQVFDEQSRNRTKILHLSMHAGASATDPMESYMAFEKDSLFVHDIYARSIPAELSILDACETGVGILNNGEGVMNLSRAFLHAGSQSVAMSLWKLTSSSETSEIIRDFVSLVENGKPKDEALRTAKLNYLNKYRKDLVLSHPFYWSPLILVGNPEAITETTWIWWILGGIGLVLMIILLWKFKGRLRL